jgi:hypothetical protein
MKGLELCEAFYRACGEKMLRDGFNDARDRIAVGMAGPGSECFGFDDELSRDHDWGPSFCLWLTEEDMRATGPRLAAAYSALPSTFMGFGPRVASPGEENRVGPRSTVDFYTAYLGITKPPDTLGQWLRLAEQALATAANGQVWADPLGEFSRWRAVLLRYYPEDVRLKKIASRCITIAQSGQYNYLRCTKRGQLYAARACEVQFCTDVISLVFLLNRRYTPYFKWAFPALRGLPRLGTETAAGLEAMLGVEAPGEKEKAMQSTCERLAEALRGEGLSDTQSDFLMDHVASIYDRIADPGLRQGVAVVR